MNLSLYEKKALMISSVGGVLEFFDFALYAVFVPYIQAVFFPNHDAMSGLVLVFSVFAIGYLARPLGGVIFGHIADKYGRSMAFSSSILIMAGSSLCISILPGFLSIGIIAPLLLMFLRFIQGISLGGEIVNASIFCAEHVTYQRRGFVIGIVFMCITLGAVAANVIASIMSHLFTDIQLQEGMWRVPFVLGAFAAIISYFLRKELLETPQFYALLGSAKVHQFPLQEIFKHHKKKLLRNFCLCLLPAITVALLLFFPSYFIQIYKMVGVTSYMVTSISFATLAIVTAVSGALADKLGRRSLLVAGGVLSVVVGMLNTLLLGCFHINIILYLSSITIAFSGGIINGVYAVAIIENLNTSVRSSAMATSYNIAYSVVTGLSPLVFIYLIHQLHFAAAPFLVFTFMAVIAFIVAVCFYENNLP